MSKQRAGLVTAVVSLAGTLVLAGGLTATGAEGPSGRAQPVQRLQISSTQEAPLDGEAFVLTVAEDEVASIRDAGSGDVTFLWSHEEDCSFVTEATAESVTAVCPNERQRSRLDRTFMLEIRDGDHVAGSGSIVVRVTAPALDMWAGGIDRRSRFGGELVARRASYDDPPANALVEIQQQTYGSDTWQSLGSTRTDERGLFRVDIEVREPGMVRAYFAGNGTVPELFSKSERLVLQPRLTVRSVGARTWLLTLKDPWGAPLGRQTVLFVTREHAQIGERRKTDRRGRARIVLGYQPKNVVYATSFTTRHWGSTWVPVKPR